MFLNYVIGLTTKYLSPQPTPYGRGC